MKSNTFPQSLTACAPLLLFAVVALAAQPAEKMVGSMEPRMSPPTATEKAPNFVALKSLDLTTAIPPCPEEASLTALTDLETLLRVQAARSAKDVEWAKMVTQGDVFTGHEFIGSWFTATNLPQTAALLEMIDTDAIAAANHAKNTFRRERPYVVSSAVTPCVDKPKGYSYPSTFAVELSLRAAVLAELLPDKKAELVAQAHQRAWGRVVGGVHFPSDIVGGYLFADAVFAQMKQNLAFQSALEKARAEITSFKAK